MVRSRRYANLAASILPLVVLGLCIQCTRSQDTPTVKVAAEATYTPKETIALGKFKYSLEGNPELTEPYMGRDEYLITWLRARELDVDAAKVMLLKNLRWRQAQNIDGLLGEELPFKRNYDIQSVDKEGRPILMVNFVKWDIRKIALSGQLPVYLRFMNQFVFEEASVKAREAGQATGSNSTQYYIMVDLAGYSVRQHGCIQCLRIFFFYMDTYENYYPQLVKETIFVNTPKIFDSIVTMTKSLWSSHLTDHVMFLGYDKNEWRRRIAEFIPLDQLPVRFGGTSPKKF